MQGARRWRINSRALAHPLLPTRARLRVPLQGLGQGMSSPNWHTRRGLLRAIAFGIGAGAIAACGTTSAETAHSSGSPATDYRLGPADQLRITVFNEPGLTGQFVIGSQGTVAFPLVGDVQAAGLTVTEFTASLRTKLE